MCQGLWRASVLSAAFLLLNGPPAVAEPAPKKALAEPLRRPAVPKVKNAAWVRNPVDAFLATEHEKRGLKPRPPAPKHILLRRVYLDLIGLPPTPAELRAFLADTSPDAYE